MIKSQDVHAQVWTFLDSFLCFIIGVLLLLQVSPWECDADRKFQHSESCMLVWVSLPADLSFSYKGYKTDYLSSHVTQKQLKYGSPFIEIYNIPTFIICYEIQELTLLPHSVSFPPTHVLLNILSQHSKL